MINTEEQSSENIMNGSCLPAIPILLPIVEDELFTGWLYRIARANGIGVNQFYRVFCQNYGKKKENYICIGNLEKICAANEESRLFPNVIDVLKRHSTYYGALPFNYLKRNILLAEGILREKDESYFLTRGANRLTKTLICPLCATEDIQKHGTVIIHTAHQFPGVTSCWKHGVKLTEKSEFQQDLIPMEATEKENSIAVFIRKTYENPLPLSREDISQMLRSLVVPIKVINKDNHFSLIEKIIAAYTPEDFIREATVYVNRKKHDKPDGNFTVIDASNLPIIRVCCNDCGDTFYTHQDSFSVGCRCPKCSKQIDKEVLFAKYLDCQYSGQYKIIRMNPRNIATVIHKPCGNVVDKYVTQLIWDQNGCALCKRKTIQSWQVKIDKKGKKYKVIDLIRNEKVPKLIIEHVGTDHEFKITPNSFIKRPFCRICEARPKRKFITEWKNSNTGYQILSKQNGINKISILHDRCGTVSLIKPREWVSGQRCFLCGCNDDTSYSEAFLRIKSSFESGKEILNINNIDPVDLQVLQEFNYINVGSDGEITIPAQQSHNYRQIDKFYENTKQKVGSVKKACNGQYMKVIRYRAYDDFDVRFEDGTEVHCNQYCNFRNGCIKNPNYKELRRKDIVNRTGERRINRYGQMMTIIAYRNASDIDVQFDNGMTVQHKKYYNFKIGRITTGNGVKTNRTGETRTMNNGMKAEIIAYRKSTSMDVKFADGFIARNVTYRDFTIGNIGNKNIKPCNKKNRIISRLGEEHVASNGMRMMIIGYNKSTDCTVEFEDGEIVYGKKYTDIVKGTVSHPRYPTISWSIRKSVVGMCFSSKEGLPFKIKSYHSCDNCDVEFEDGTVVYHVPLYRIRKGRIKYPIGQKRLNEVHYTKDGRRFKIIIWRKNSKCDIQFEDGTIVRHLKYTEIECGTVTYPLYKHGKRVKRTRIGEKHKAINGENITIIDYRGYGDCDVQFADGTIVHHVSYSRIKQGKVKPQITPASDKQIVDCPTGSTS